MSNMTTEEIFWRCIKDIEEGKAITIKEDPINGFLKGNNKSLTKRNVCAQSAKYNDGKPFSRPTLDSYKEISSYITGIRKSNNPDYIRKENKELKEKLGFYQKIIEQLKEKNSNLANENYRLNELTKSIKKV